MPIYIYKCSQCKKLFEDFSYKSDYYYRVISPCCHVIGYRLHHYSRFLLRVTQKPKSNPLTNEIPIGEVPGDDDYTKECGGHKMGETGYIGPLP
jgi:hypothetical protein